MDLGSIITLNDGRRFKVTNSSLRTIKRKPTYTNQSDITESPKLIKLVKTFPKSPLKVTCQIEYNKDQIISAEKPNKIGDNSNSKTNKLSNPVPCNPINISGNTVRTQGKSGHNCTILSNEVLKAVNVPSLPSSSCNSVISNGTSNTSINNEFEQKLLDEYTEITLEDVKNLCNPVYNEETNTLVKYRIIHPNDIDITKNNKFIIRDRQKLNDAKKFKKEHSVNNKTIEENKNVGDCVENGAVKETSATEQMLKNKKKRPTYQRITLNTDKEETVKTTRSGRRVRLPKARLDIIPNKQKLETYVDVLTCLRCEGTFAGNVKLNRHYAKFPLHRPNNRHTNLFRCFLDVVRRAPAGEAGDVLVEQLQELVSRLRAMRPCMINNMESDGDLCYINEDLGRMLDMEPGKYNISFKEALECLENKNKKCNHLKVNSTNAMKADGAAKATHVWVTEHNDDVAVLKIDDSNCARTHSVDKWPFIKKRVQKFLPTKLVANHSKQSANVDIISISKEDGTKLPDNSKLQKTEVWVMPVDRNNEIPKLYKIPSTNQIPVLKLDSKQTEQLKVNVISAYDPTNKENTKVKENVKDISKKLSTFQKIDTFTPHFIPISDSITQITQSMKDEVLSSFEHYQNPKNVNVTTKQFTQLKQGDLTQFNYQNQSNLKSHIDDSSLSNKSKDIIHFEEFETTQFNPLQPKKVSKPQKELSHFDQYTSSQLNIQSTPIKSSNTTFSKIQIKDNMPMFVKLTKDDSLSGDIPSTSDLNTSGDSSNMQLDISSIFSQLNEDLNKKQSDMIMSDSSNEFYNSNQSSNNLTKDFTIGSASAPTVCDMAHHVSNLLHNSYVMTNSPAHRTPSDQLLSSDCIRLNPSLVSSQTCSNASQNNFTNSRINQNDCLLSRGSNEISANDRLLSSGNLDMTQNDQLLTSNQNDSLSNLCGSESNLDSSRMSLPLLDHLTTDCLSFTDTEQGSSLDLPLDLFPFSNAE